MTLQDRMSARIDSCPWLGDVVYDCQKYGLLLSVPQYSALQSKAKIVFSKTNEHAPYILVGKNRFLVTEETQLLKYERGYLSIMGRFTNQRGLHKLKLHRLVYVAAYGPPPRGYHIHHIDGDKRNNAIDNLVALSPEEHCEVHKRDVRVSYDLSNEVYSTQNYLIAASQGKCLVCFEKLNLYYLVQTPEPQLIKAKYCPSCGRKLK